MTIFRKPKPEFVWDDLPKVTAIDLDKFYADDKFWDDLAVEANQPRRNWAQIALTVAQGAFIGLALALAFTIGHVSAQPTSSMPCHWEDEVLVGTGDFVQDYGWTGSKCIPADDL